MIERHEHYLNNPAHAKLFFQSWKSTTLDSKGCILITHGISEHSECYHPLATILADKGWHVFAWDLQGHGKSPGKRGYISDFSEFRKDLKTIVKTIKDDDNIKSNPFYLLGHSMGGLITLSALMNENISGLTATILSSPCLGIAVEVPKIKEVASQWLNNFWPTLTMNNEVRLDLLSREPKMQEVYRKDALRHTKVSAPLYIGMLNEISGVLKNPQKITIPVFFQVAGDDRIVDAKESLEFFKKITGPKKLKHYENSYHEIYNDTNRQETIDDLLSYLGE